MAKTTSKGSGGNAKRPARQAAEAGFPQNVITVINKDPLYVPPSFRPPYCSYPPYCRNISPTMDKWRTARLRVEVEVSADPLETRVEGWVNQLVRGQIGEALEAIETRLGRKLAIKLDPFAVKLIDEAMKARSEAS